MNIPIKGKQYNCFDDGKISKSRLYFVRVLDIIAFNDIDEETLTLWNEEVETCHWLYAKETDYFIKTINEDEETEYFVRTINDGWFSIGGFLNCGRLDIDGTLTKLLNKNYG